jgi:alkaline phosphatase D
MKTIFITFCLWMASASIYAQQTNAERLAQIGDLDRLAFGSCNKQYRHQPLWKDLIEQAPDLFLWGGDNVYANTDSAAKLRASYQRQNGVDDYRLFKALTPIVGTWDDHDYGNNNQDGTYPLKRQGRDYALDFLEEPPLSPRRLREGIYTSYEFGSPGKIVKLILLDNRYFMNLDAEFPLLGRTQWDWLREEVQNTRASLILVASGLSILSPATAGSEEWADYAKERDLLRRLLSKKNVPYLYLTGDKHFSSIFRRGDEVEFMASGMTHNTKEALRPYVRARYPNPVFENNYGLIDLRWEDGLPELTLTVRTARGQAVLVRKLRWELTRWRPL